MEAAQMEKIYEYLRAQGIHILHNGEEDREDERMELSFSGTDGIRTFVRRGRSLSEGVYEYGGFIRRNYRGREGLSVSQGKSRRFGSKAEVIGSVSP